MLCPSGLANGASARAVCARSVSVTVSAKGANSLLNVAQSWLHSTKHSLRSLAEPEARTRSTRGAAYGNARRPTPWTMRWKYATTR